MKPKCKYFNYKHTPKWKKCPVFEQLYKTCKKENNFQTGCKFKKEYKSIEHVRKIEENSEIEIVIVFYT